MNITTPVEKKRLNSNYCATLGKEKGENGNNKYSLPPKAISVNKNHSKLLHLMLYNVSSRTKLVVSKLRPNSELTNIHIYVPY